MSLDDGAGRRRVGGRRRARRRRPHDRRAAAGARDRRPARPRPGRGDDPGRQHLPPRGRVRPARRDARARRRPHPRQRRGRARDGAGGDGRPSGGDGRGRQARGCRPPTRSSCRATASSPGSSPRRTSRLPATSCGSSSRSWAASSCASLAFPGHEHRRRHPARRPFRRRAPFAAGPAPPADRRRAPRGRRRAHLRDARPRHRPRDRRGRPGGRRGRRPRRRAPRARPSRTGAGGHAPAAQRTRAMLALADAIEEHADELAQLESLDNGKPVKLATARRRGARRPRTSATSRAGRRKIEGEMIPVGPAEHALLHAQGAGRACAAQIIPWNFPLLMAAWKLAPGAGGGLHDRARSPPSRRR